MITRVIDIRTDEKEALSEAARLIKDGEVVGIPTETVLILSLPRRRSG